MKVTVYFEDSRDVDTYDFPFNTFILQLVIDENCLADHHGLGGAELHVVERFVKALPMNGSGALLARITRDAPRAQDWGPVLCILDDDRVRDALQLPHGTSKNDVVNNIMHRSGNSFDSVILLPGNVESLQRIIVERLNLNSSFTQKNRTIRDKVFSKATRASTIEQRRAIRNQYYVLDRIVDAYCTALWKLNKINNADPAPTDET